MRETSFSRYRKLQQKGIPADEAYLQAKNDGMSENDRARMLNSIYHLSYKEAVRISRAAGDSPPSLLDNKEQPNAVRAAVSILRKKRVTNSQR